jgi:kynurenine formamidase
MLIDLSHTIEPGMPVYPESSPPQIRDLGLFPIHGVHVRELTLDGHVGTHLDVPAHLFAAAPDTASLPVDTFFGTATVVDCTPVATGGVIPPAVLDQVRPDTSNDFLLFHTGWDRHWGRQAYFEGFPVCSPDLARRLAGLAIKGVGFDTISVDAVAATDLPNHKTLLGAGKVVIENLTGLDRLAGKAFRLACFPLKIAAGDGSPVRAVAIL